jgi:hypothetical protein
MILRSATILRIAMTRHILWCAVLLAVPQAASAAEGVPVYNVRPECNFTQSVIPSPESEKTCLREEQDARTKLEKNWASYADDDRSECIGESSSAGSPSYVDLLTCLEMNRDVRALERKEKAAEE